MNQLINFKKILKSETKDFSLYTLSMFITGLSSFVIVPLFWHKLTPSDYGIIAITEIIGTFLSIFLGLAIDQGITRFYYEWQENVRKRRIGTLWVLSWSSSIFFGFSSLVFLKFTSKIFFPSINFYPYIFLGIIIGTLNSFGSVPLAVLRIIKLAKLFVFYQLTTFFLKIGMAILFVLILKKGVEGYLFSNILSGCISASIYLFVMLKFSTPNLNYLDVKESLKFSVNIIPSSIISVFSTIMDRFLLQQFVSLHDLGIYSICLKFASLISQLHNALKLSFAPFVYKTLSENRERGKQIVSNMLRVYILPLFIIVLLLLLFTEDFVLWMNKESYFSVIEYVPFSAFSVLISSLYVYLAPGIILSKKTKLLFVPAIIQLVVLTVAGYLLLPNYQIYGILYSKLISALIFLLSSIYISNKVYKFNYPWISVFFYFGLMLTSYFLYNIIKIDFPKGRIVLSVIIMISFIGISFFHIKKQFKQFSLIKNFE